MPTPPTSVRAQGLHNADWLQRPSLARVFKALNNAGGEARVVGGAVRNALLGEPVADIDLATNLDPQTVISRAAAAGLAAYPTGIDHGTVTLVADGESYEVTTLRRDVETDGRHAVVAFTSDWHQDAMRRDFTINALSATADGDIFDTVGGLADLEQRRVRFIGDAESRIREDYLRILRFFRFTSAYAEGPPDANGLAAARALKDGMRQLSAERIGTEMMKFIVTPRAAEISEIMQRSNILQVLTACAARPEHLQRLQLIEAALGEPADAITRMAALLLNRAHDVSALVEDFRLSNAISSALEAATTVKGSHDAYASEHASKVEIYRSGRTAFQHALRVAWARSGAPATDGSWTERSRLAASWSPPQLPVSGSDVVALGVPAGPRVGHILRGFEAWWLDAGFPNDVALQKEKLAELTAGS